jgi:AGZA family xanthine/uracil permease-like MFS transporter
VPGIPDDFFVGPDLGLFGEFSLLGGFHAVGVLSASLFVLTLVMADFFDTIGTSQAVAEETGLLDEGGKPLNIRRILLVDSLAAAAGGVTSSSSNTSYIESTTGGAGPGGNRTGLAPIVTGSLFLLAMFATPLVQIVPYEAATPALVIVGFLLMSRIGEIDWRDWEVALPAFFGIVLMPFTYSITNGIGAMFVLYAILRLVNGKRRDTHWLIFVIALLFVAYFAIEYVERGLGIS